MNNILQTKTMALNVRSQTDFVQSFVNTSSVGLNSVCANYPKFTMSL